MLCGHVYLHPGAIKRRRSEFRSWQETLTPAPALLAAARRGATRHSHRDGLRLSRPSPAALASFFARYEAAALPAASQRGWLGLCQRQWASKDPADGLCAPEARHPSVVACRCAPLASEATLNRLTSYPGLLQGVTGTSTKATSTKSSWSSRSSPSLIPPWAPSVASQPRWHNWDTTTLDWMTCGRSVGAMGPRTTRITMQTATQWLTRPSSRI